MLRNYISIALRVFKKHPMFTLINILGLTLGLTSTLFILLWVQDEMGFDRFHEKTEQLYQLIREEQYPDGSYEYLTATPGLMGPTLKEEYAEISNTCRLGWEQSYNVRFEDKLLKRNARFVDPAFFNMFSFHLLKGDRSQLLKNPNELVISKSTARAIFDNEDPIGKVLEVRDTEFNYSFTISGVIDDFPSNSFAHGIDLLLPIEAVAKNLTWLQGWGGNALSLFVEVNPQTNVDELNQAIVDIVRRNTDNEVYDVYLQPLAERHLYADIQPVKNASGRIVYVRLFSAIALFILLIACINFMNLATARSSARMKEVGVRKVIGARKKDLIGQFMSEAFLIMIISMGISLVSSAVLLPVFNKIAEKSIVIPWDQPVFYLLLLLILIIAAGFSGSYPSFYLSSFKPIRVLKGRFDGAGRSVPLRKVLVIFQFTLSIVLMIASWMVYQQIEYFRGKNLGLDQENVIYFQSTQEIQRNQEVFASRLQEKQTIQSATFSGSLPTAVQTSTSSPSWAGKSVEANVEFQILFTGLNFLNTTKIQLVQGRSFNTLADTSKIIINSVAAALIGKESLLGEVVTFWGGTYEVIGVVADFHSNRLHEPIAPVILTLAPNFTEYALVRSAGADIEETLADINGIFHEYSPHDTFDYHFLDETVQAVYLNERLVGKLAAIFTSLAILISCLGLFGLAAFNFERKKKETGVRKVLGASLSHIIYIFSREFLQLVFWALLIASPIAWWLSTSWLKQFHYHTTFHWTVILMMGLAAIFIALATVGWHAIKAANENPVDALKYE